HVAGGGVGVEIGQHITGVRLTGLGEAGAPLLGELVLLRGAGLGGRGAVLVGLLVAQALDPGGAGHAAGVEAHQDVGGADVGGDHERHALEEVHAGAARSAGVGDQGADPVAAGGHPSHGDLDVPGVRGVPGQGYGDRAAFDVLALDVLAGAPVDRLLVVLRVGGILRRVRGEALRGGGAGLLERG